MTERSARPEAGHYEIRLAGRLDPRWTAWFEGLDVRAEDDGTTVLSGPVADQAELHGLLRRTGDLGLPLVSVTRIEPTTGADHPPTTHVKPRRPTR